MTFLGSKPEQASFKNIERLIVDYFDAAGADVVEKDLEWFLSLYDEGPSISLTSLAVEVARHLQPAPPPPHHRATQGE